jgi:hypothetical protein
MKILLCLCIPMVTGLLMSSCKDSSRAVQLIDTPGTYKAPSGKYALVVSITAKKTVQYAILRTEDKTQVGSGDSGSRFMRWYFVWDQRDQLWVHNSDAGDWVWTPGASFTEYDLMKDAAKAKEAPRAFYDALPDSIKAEFAPRS